MGIFKRINDIALASIHDALDKMENPLSMVKQYIRELEEKISEAKMALVNQLLTERKFETLMNELQQAIQKRVRQANLALDRKEEQMAQLAVEEKLACEKKLRTYQEQYEAVKQQTSALEGEIQKLQGLYYELQNKKLFLLSRANTAQAIRNVNSTVSAADTDSIRRNFARMEEQIWQLEANAAAVLRVNQPAHSPSAAAAGTTVKADVLEELERMKEARKSSAAE